MIYWQNSVIYSSIESTITWWHNLDFNKVTGEKSQSRMFATQILGPPFHLYRVLFPEK